MRIPFVLVALMIASPSWADVPSPVQTSIQKLLRSPQPYSNKIVRVTGQIDNCFGFTCNICPDEMTDRTFDAKQCLGVSFEGYASENANAYALMDKAFRFAVVTLDARFDPACLDTEKSVCLDRVSELFEARVVKVQSRHSALDGIVSWYHEGTLLTASLVDERDMQTEVGAVLPLAKDEEVRFFVVDYEDPTRQKTGLACLCPGKTCEGRWPTRFFWGFSSVGSPFSCVLMKKLNIGWRIIPGDF